MRKNDQFTNDVAWEVGRVSGGEVRSSVDSGGGGGGGIIEENVLYYTLIRPGIKKIF